MVRTASTMLPLGTPAPTFTLPDATGKVMHFSDFDEERGLLVMFISNHCPYVKMLREALAALGREYQQKCVSVVAIMSNDVANYPDDSPEKMVDEIIKTYVQTRITATAETLLLASMQVVLPRLTVQEHTVIHGKTVSNRHRFSYVFIFFSSSIRHL